MLIKIAVAVAVISTLPATSYAQESPVFGKAVVKITTDAQNKSIVGKGSYADLYGYYGNIYAINALAYGTYGYYYKNYNDYSYASSYASTAATYYSYAAYYQYYGY